MKLRKFKRRKNKEVSSQNQSQDYRYFLNLANQYYQAGKWNSALTYYQKALKRNPYNADIYNGIGTTCQVLGTLDKAMESYLHAIDIKPDHADAHHNLGNIYYVSGNMDQAASHFRCSLKVNPKNSDALNNLGVILLERYKINREREILDEAIFCYQGATVLNSNHAESYHNLGMLLEERDDFDSAISSYMKAIEINPNYAETYYNLGMAYSEKKESKKAIECFYKAIELKPSFDEVWLALYKELAKGCHWPELAEISIKLDTFIDQYVAGVKATISEKPFGNASRCTDVSRNFIVAQANSSEIARKTSSLSCLCEFGFSRKEGRKIVIGYLSHDFCNHAVAHQMVNLFSLHDRKNFVVHGYSYGKNDESYYRKKIEKDCDKFVDLRHFSHVDAAKCIYKDGVDILVDLTGHTKGGRLEICTFRPAPILVSYIIPVTTGADFIDYFIADRCVVPESHESCYSENLVFLPDCYMVTDSQQKISDRKWTRAEINLSPETFIYGSFNALFKIDSSIFHSWLNILQKVPNSVLCLSRANAIARAYLLHEAEKRGVHEERIIFFEKMQAKDDYLARLQLVDLVLDTVNFNGHVTTCDALWAGVPVLTTEGNHFASRVSASMLMAIGLGDVFVAKNLEEYEQLAVHFAEHQDELSKLRDRLRKNRFTRPLFNASHFVKNLERAYNEMWKIFIAGETPRRIDVMDSGQG